MKKLSVNIAKCLLVLFPLFITACVNSNDPAGFSFADSFSVHEPINLYCNYSVSSDVKKSNSGPSSSASILSRSATAAVPAGITYFVTAETTDGSRTVNVPSSDIDLTNRSFTISLITGYEWKITAGIKNSAGQEILSDSVTKRLTPNDTLMAPTFKLKPHITAGKTGDLSLYVTCPAGYSLSVSDETSTTWNVSPDPLVANKYQVTASNVASGTYNLILTFTKAGVPPFITSQIVTIYDNLETNSWHSGGNALINDGNFELTTAIVNLATENRTDFYVDGTPGGPGNDNNSGNYQSPFASISKAFGIVNAIGNTTYYKIHIKNGTSYTLSSGIDITKNTIIDCYASSPGDNAGTATLTATGSIDKIFSNEFGKQLWIYGLNIDGGNISGIIGINQSGSGTTLTTRITGGSIKNCSRGIMFDNGNVTLIDTEITDNTNSDTSLPGAGVCHTGTGNGYLYIKGSTKIIGNKASDNSPQNLFLDSGRSLELDGPLTTGAMIGVLTRDPPTLSLPKTFTVNYHNYHSTTHPGTYFLGDVYGVSQNAAGEATLNLSGGSITNQFYDNITLSCAKFISPNTPISSDSVSKAIGLPRTYQFTALAPDGTDLTSTNINDFSLISFKNQGTNYGSDYAEQQTGTNKNKVQLKAACLPGTYYLTMGFTYFGITYTSTLRVVVTN